jgi:hypothetical protein
MLRILNNTRTVSERAIGLKRVLRVVHSALCLHHAPLIFKFFVVTTVYFDASDVTLLTVEDILTSAL